MEILPISSLFFLLSSFILFCFFFFFSCILFVEKLSSKACFLISLLLCFFSYTTKDILKRLHQLVGPTCAYESSNWPLAHDRVTHVVGIVLGSKSGSGSKTEARIRNIVISQLNKAGYMAYTTSLAGGQGQSFKWLGTVCGWVGAVKWRGWDSDAQKSLFKPILRHLKFR